MKTVGNSERIFRYLLNLNFWIVMVLGGVIAKSIRGYIREQSAHEFLMSVTAVPVTPWKTCVLLVLLFFCLVFLLQIREESNGFFYCRTGLELLIGLLICYLLQFSYSGIFLLVLAVC